MGGRAASDWNTAAAICPGQLPQARPPAPLTPTRLKLALSSISLLSGGAAMGPHAPIQPPSLSFRVIALTLTENALVDACACFSSAPPPYVHAQARSGHRQRLLTKSELICRFRSLVHI